MTQVYHFKGEKEMKKYIKKRIEKNMKHMAYDDAVEAAEKQARLLELSKVGEVFDKSIEICQQMAEYVESSDWDGNDVQVALWNTGRTLELYDNRELVKEIISIATNFKYEKEDELEGDGKKVLIILYSVVYNKKG